MKKYPLKFLDSYTKADTDIFFGRNEEVDALYEMIFQTDILLLYGASGTGKTSLIQCGLASRFESHDWLDLGCTIEHKKFPNFLYLI
jgi:Cdc6-like AAA superfamily ATPase